MFKSCELRHSWSRFKFWCNSTISFYIFTSLSHLYLLNLSGLSKIQPVCLSEVSECLYRAVKFRKFQKRKTTDPVGFTFFPIFIPICVTVVNKIIPLRCRLWRIDLRQERKGFHLPQARWRRPAQKTSWKRLWQRVLRGMCYSHFSNGVRNKAISIIMGVRNRRGGG